MLFLPVFPSISLQKVWELVNTVTVKIQNHSPSKSLSFAIDILPQGKKSVFLDTVVPFFPDDSKNISEIIL